LQSSFFWLESDTLALHIVNDKIYSQVLSIGIFYNNGSARLTALGAAGARFTLAAFLALEKRDSFDRLLPG